MGVFRVQRGPLSPCTGRYLSQSYLLTWELAFWRSGRLTFHSPASPSPGHPGRILPVARAQAMPVVWLLLIPYWQLFLHSYPGQEGSSSVLTLVLLAVSWEPLTGYPPSHLAWLFQPSVKDLVSFLGVTPCLDFYIIYSYKNSGNA